MRTTKKIIIKKEELEEPQIETWRKDKKKAEREALQRWLLKLKGYKIT